MTTFITAIDGYAVDLDYTIENESLSEQASIVPCEPGQETEEPTPTSTTEPTEVPSEETQVSEDPEPDQPAGGMGPSIMSTLIPILGITGIAATATLVLKNKKETTL